MSAVNWHKVLKIIRDMKLIPKDRLFPNYDYVGVRHHIICSTREIGKTTSFLLMGLVAYREYNVNFVYVRQTTEMRYPKNTRGLFNVIRANDYIAKIYNDEWNDVLISSRYWYLIKRDVNGDIIKKDVNPVCVMCSIEEHEELKSSLNLPFGDLIIVDELIGSKYRYNEFFMLMDLIKTVIRQRTSAIIIYLANTVDYTSEYFAEFECDDLVRDMSEGEEVTYTTYKGTKVHLALLGVPTISKENRREQNKLYFGFKNPLLGSITGDTEWAFAEYPKQYGEITLLEKRLYMKYNGVYIRCDIVSDDNNRVMVLCHKATRVYDDSYVLVKTQAIEANEHYYYKNRLAVWLLDMYSQNRVIFSNNKIGHIFDTFFNVKIGATFV